MKRSSCVTVVVAALLAGGCAAGTVSLPLSGPSLPRAQQMLRIRVATGGKSEIRQVPLEEYVHASILSEVAPASGDVELVRRMLEVQAILSRSYALSHLDRHRRDGYDLCDATHCQLFEPDRLRTSRWAAAGADAVRRTRGVVVWFDAAPASALFHADCGGHTSTPVTVWGGTARPYLPTLADDGPAATAHAAWHYNATRDALRRALNADLRTAPGSRLDDLTIVERDRAGRAVLVRISGQHTREVKGETMRDVLTRAFGVRTIRSTRLDIRKDKATYRFDGQGFGHGVGLCQAGAMARLAAGSSPAEVLARYFPGTRLVTLTRH